VTIIHSLGLHLPLPLDLPQYLLIIIHFVLIVVKWNIFNIDTCCCTLNVEINDPKILIHELKTSLHLLIWINQILHIYLLQTSNATLTKCLCRLCVILLSLTQVVEVLYLHMHAW
jgi:hypothetical protein